MINNNLLSALGNHMKSNGVPHPEEFCIDSDRHTYESPAGLVTYIASYDYHGHDSKFLLCSYGIAEQKQYSFTSIY